MESAGDAGESDIKRETRRDMKDNEVTGLKDAQDYVTSRMRVFRADEALLTTTT